jgi:NitT/TauT family transport system substrate-binding protein
MARRLMPGLVVLTLLGALACTAPAAPPPASAPAAPPPGQAAAPAAPTAPAPPPRQTVRYGYVPILAAAAMFVAYERGYFTEQNIDLEMVPFDSGALLVPAVSAGQLEAGHGVPGPALFNALAREINMKAVSVISWNGTQLMVRRDLADEIRSVQDLRGRRVSFMIEGSPIDFTMRRVLYQNGMSLRDVDLQRLPMPDTAPALANAALDAGAVVEPFPVLIETRGIGVRALGVQDMVWKDAASIVLVGPSMLSRSDAAITAFLVGFVKGLRALEATLRDNRVTDPAVQEIISRWTNIPVEIIAQAAMSGAPPNGRIDLNDLNRQQDFWAQEGDVRVKADLNAFVEYKYLDAAVAQLP